MCHRLGLRFRKTELNHIREIQGSSTGVEIKSSGIRRANELFLHREDGGSRHLRNVGNY
jgi:hypothetical protein